MNNGYGDLYEWTVAQNAKYARDAIVASFYKRLEQGAAESSIAAGKPVSVDEYLRRLQTLDREKNAARIARTLATEAEFLKAIKDSPVGKVHVVANLGLSDRDRAFLVQAENCSIKGASAALAAEVARIKESMK